MFGIKISPLHLVSPCANALTKIIRLVCVGVCVYIGDRTHRERKETSSVFFFFFCFTPKKDRFFLVAKDSLRRNMYTAVSQNRKAASRDNFERKEDNNPLDSKIRTNEKHRRARGIFLSAVN